MADREAGCGDVTQWTMLKELTLISLNPFDVLWGIRSYLSRLFLCEFHVILYQSIALGRLCLKSFGWNVIKLIRLGDSGLQRGRFVSKLGEGGCFEGR